MADKRQNQNDDEIQVPAEKFAVIPLYLLSPYFVDYMDQKQPGLFKELLKNLYRACKGEPIQYDKTEFLGCFIEHTDLDKNGLPIVVGDIYEDQQYFNVTRVKFRRRKA